MNSPSTCRYCGRRIAWAITRRNGANMPVDPRPSDDGTVQLVDAGGFQEAHLVGPAEAARLRANRVPLHTTHFATCPGRRESGPRVRACERACERARGTQARTRTVGTP